MKKTIQFSCFFAALLCLFCSTASQAQDVDKALATFTQQFQETYNKEDHATLQTFYTADAIHMGRTAPASQVPSRLARFGLRNLKVLT